MAEKSENQVIIEQHLVAEADDASEEIAEIEKLLASDGKKGPPRDLPKLHDFDDADLYGKEKDLLDRKKEYELARRWLSYGDERAREKIVASYERLAISYAQRASRSGLNFDDLLQESKIGMLNALEKFDPSLGNGFGTFARFHMRNKIQLHGLDFIAPYRIYNTAATKALLAQFNTHKKRLEAETGRPLSDIGRDEICKILKVDREQMKRFEIAISGTTPIDVGAGNSADDQTRAVELASGNANGDAGLVSKLARGKILGLLKEALAALPDRERQIISARFRAFAPETASDDDENPMTLDSLSKELGISRERVRQIEIKAIAGLKEWFMERGVDSIGELFDTEE